LLPLPASHTPLFSHISEKKASKKARIDEKNGQKNPYPHFPQFRFSHIVDDFSLADGAFYHFIHRLSRSYPHFFRALFHFFPSANLKKEAFFFLKCVKTCLIMK